MTSIKSGSFLFLGFHSGENKNLTEELREDKQDLLVCLSVNHFYFIFLPCLLVKLTSTVFCVDHFYLK